MSRKIKKNRKITRKRRSRVLASPVTVIAQQVRSHQIVIFFLVISFRLYGQAGQPSAPVGGISLESSEISVRRDKDFPMIMKTIISHQPGWPNGWPAFWDEKMLKCACVEGITSAFRQLFLNPRMPAKNRKQACACVFFEVFLEIQEQIYVIFSFED